jgi:hypothetical protein
MHLQAKRAFPVLPKIAFLLAAGAVSLVFPSVPRHARAEAVSVEIVLKDHKFEPAEVKVPANTEIKLTVRNEDATPEEFESHALGIEKVIAGKTSGTVRIKPLKPGQHKFVGEYNEDTAKGVVIAE